MLGFALRSPSLPIAPKRLQLETSRTADMGTRLVGFILKLIQRNHASKYWIVAREQQIVLLGKTDDSWSILFQHRTYHADCFINSLQELTTSGSLTVESNQTAYLWNVSHGCEDFFLQRR